MWAQSLGLTNLSISIFNFSLLIWIHLNKAILKILKLKTYLSSQTNRLGSSGSATYFSLSLTTKSWISFIRLRVFNSSLSGVGSLNLSRFSFSFAIFSSLSFFSWRKCFPLFSWKIIETCKHFTKKPSYHRDQINLEVLILLNNSSHKIQIKHWLQPVLK